MTRVEREDLTGNNLDATIKVVGAGEIRTRLRINPRVGMRIAAVHATKPTEVAWQEPHVHNFITETYVVVQGEIGAVSWGRQGEVVDGGVYGAGQSFIFNSGRWHNILTSPGAEFVTVQLNGSAIATESDRVVADVLPVAVVEKMAEVAALLEQIHLQ